MNLRDTVLGGTMCNPRQEFLDSAQFHQKKLKLDELVTRTYPLDDVNAAMSALEKGEVLRSVLVMA